MTYWHFTLHSVHFVYYATANSFHFYPNVTTIRSGLCYRNSVCRLSSVCLSVTLVHPTQGVEAFGNISSPLSTLAIL